MMPRGVQLHLGNSNEPHLQDTLVMSNLGYFQLKAAPGAWTLQLAPGNTYHHSIQLVCVYVLLYYVR